MSWQLIALIGIIASAAVSIPVFYMVWKVFSKAIGAFDDFQKTSVNMVNDHAVSMREMDEEIRRMTGPSADPFRRFR